MALSTLVTLGALAGCSDDDLDPPGTGGQTAGYAVVHQDLPGALLSVWGTSASDVWAVGGDVRDGTGPLVLHYDGSGWEQLETGQSEGDLWWVFGFEEGPIYMGGAGGMILRYEEGTFTAMNTPGTGTVFGIWGSDNDDVWAVGGTFDKSGFAWHLEGDSWLAEPSLPAEVVAEAAIWKVFGRSASEVWLVGSGGVSFFWDGTTLTQADTGVGSSLFTVHANAQRFAAVGGLASGFIVENEGAGWSQVASSPYGLTGVVLGAGEEGYAVGQYGSIFERDDSGWHERDAGLPTEQDLHGVWRDPSGGVWAVGGHTASLPLTGGLLVHRGNPISSEGL